MIKFGEYENGTEVVIAEFGSGDICVGGYIDTDGNDVSLVICNIGENKPIGSELFGFKGKIASELDHPVIFEFSNRESIDVVIEALIELKGRLKKEE